MHKGIWVECSPMVRKPGFQFKVKSYQRLKKLYLIPPCLALRSRVKWSNPGIEVASSLHLSVVAIEKGAFWSPSTKVANFIFYLIWVYIYYKLYIEHLNWIIPLKSINRIYWYNNNNNNNNNTVYIYIYIYIYISYLSIIYIYTNTRAHTQTHTDAHTHTHTHTHTHIYIYKI